MSEEIWISRENPRSQIETDWNFAHQQMILELGGVIADYASPTSQGVLRRFSPDGPQFIYQSRPTGLQCAEPMPPFGESRIHKVHAQGVFWKKLKFLCYSLYQNAKGLLYLNVLKSHAMRLMSEHEATFRGDGVRYFVVQCGKCPA